MLRKPSLSPLVFGLSWHRPAAWTIRFEGWTTIGTCLKRFVVDSIWGLLPGMLKPFGNLRLQTKLVGAFVLMLTIMLLLGGLTIRAGVQRLDAVGEVTQSYDTVDEISRVRWNLSQTLTSYRSYMLYGDIAYLASYNSGLEQYTDSYRSLWDGSEGNDEIVPQLVDLERRVQSWRTSILDPGIAIRSSVTKGETKANAPFAYLRESPGVDEYQSISTTLDDLYATVSDALVDDENRVDARQKQLVSLLIGCPLLIVVSGVVIGWALARDIAGEMATLTRQARRMADGDLKARIATTRRDEIGTTAAAFNDMADKLSESIEQHRELVTQSEAREHGIRTVVNNIAEGLVSFGPDGMIISSNPATQSMFAPDQTPLSGRALHSLLRGKDADASIQPAELLPGTDATVSVSTILQGVRTDGTMFPLELAIKAVPDSDDGLYIGVLRDITEQLEAERRLEEQVHSAETAESRTRAVLDATGEAIILISDDGTIASVNQRFMEFFDQDPADLVGMSAYEFGVILRKTIVEADQLVRLMQLGMVDTGLVLTEHFTQQWPEHRDLELFSTFISTRDGRPLGRLFALRDITHQQEVERLKNEFVSHVSHELRTPLTSIIGYADLLIDEDVGAINDDQRDFLGVVRGNAERLLTMVNDLLDISRIEAGRIDLYRTLVDLDALVHSVAASVQPMISSRGQQFSIERREDVPPVEADPNRVIQILTNLISNASKYTPKGGKITVSYRVLGSDLAVDITDTGVGVTPEEQSLLFDRFFRARNRATREAAGAGLGLTITQTLVQLHGGNISVQSKPGHGSTFTFTLPLPVDAVPSGTLQGA